MEVVLKFFVLKNVGGGGFMERTKGKLQKGLVRQGHRAVSPEVRTCSKTLEGNIKVAKFTLATTEGYKDENGQVHSQTEWHNIVLWRGLDELAEKYLKKGSLVHLEGKKPNPLLR